MIETRKQTLSPQKMIKQAQKTKGYLFKKSGGIIGGWKQRYFIIFNGALSYYSDEALVDHKGQIKIKDIQSIVMKQTDVFLLQTRKKQYEFKCENQQVCDLWVASLNLLKQYVSDDDLTKKFLFKRIQQVKKADRFQLCKIDQIRKILLQMKLNLLAEQLDQSRIHHRIYCQKVEDSFYISISIKCLELNEIDQQILSEKYVIPYNFNKLYRVYKDGKIQDIAKMSQMQSLKSLQGSVVICFSDKKKILIPYKNQAQAYQITKKLCRCYQVAREYYNSFKIVLKKNIDKLIELYDNQEQQFQSQTIRKTRQHLNRFSKNSTQQVSILLSEFRFIKRDLIQTQQACKVLSTIRDDIKFSYFRLVHQEVRKCLSKAWESLFAQFQPKNLIALSIQLYEYWLVVNPVVSDSTILEGCMDLNIFFMGRLGQSIKQKIHSFNAQKVQYQKIKNEPIGNQITNTFYDWLKQVNSCLNQFVPIQTIFVQYCRFYLKCFDQFLEYLTDISEKWNQISVVIGACNDLCRIKHYFIKDISSELCKGIFAEKKFHNSCGNEIIKKIKQCQASLIKRSFILFFRNIDKKLLAKPFLQIDFSKICYEVLQRLQPYKSKLLQQVQYEMVILSFDEICFFLYTTLINKNVPSIKNLKEHYIKAIEKDLTQIQQFYCNIKTQEYVKKYLKQLAVLKQILSCPESAISKYIGDLSITFGASFTEDSVSTILNIRQTTQDNYRLILQQCLNGLKKCPSSQDSQSYQESHIRSRKSTLTESLYTIPGTNRFISKKVVKQGYLQMKKVTKGIPNFFNRSYFKIKDGHLFQYNCVNSNEILSSIQLTYADYCYLDSQAPQKSIFIIMIESTIYYFKAANRDEAGLWIQAVYSEIKHPLFQNKSQYPQEEKKNALFKNMEVELTTTASNKRKTGQHLDDEKVLQQKRTRRIKQIAEVKKNTQQQGNCVNRGKSPVPKKISPKKKLKKEIAKQDEGTFCCGKKIF